MRPFNFKTIFFTILLSLTVAFPASAEYFSDIIITSPNAIWTDSRAYSTLNAAITDAGTNERTIVIVNEQIVTTLTVPANITLRFERDGSISNSGQLTFQTKKIISESRQIFTGTGDIDFAAGTVVKSGWFSDFVEAVDMTADDEITLVVSEQSYITANCILGNDVSLKWESPNLIVANAGFEFSNIGKIEAGDYQLFAGNGDFDFLDGSRLKLSWFASLQAALAWIENEEVTIVVSGTNQVSSNETSTANVYFDFASERGQFSIDVGRSLTINSPSNVIASPKHQIFSGSGIVYFTSPGGQISAGWFGDDGDAIQAATNSAVPATEWGESAVYIPGGDWIVTTSAPFTPTKGIAKRGIKFTGDGWTSTRIILNPSGTDLYFYDNVATARLNFATFTDMAFFGLSDITQAGYGDISDNAKGFRLYSKSHEQGFKFTRCWFSGLHTGFELVGTNTASEIIFISSKFTKIKDVVCSINNLQSMNHTFISTDLEVIFGDFIRVGTLGGGEVKVYGGSWIAQTGAAHSGVDEYILDISAGAAVGASTSLFTFNGVRFENRGNNAKLVRALGGTLRAVYRDCTFWSSGVTAAKTDWVKIKYGHTVTFDHSRWSWSDATYQEYYSIGSNAQYGNAGKIIWSNSQIINNLSDYITFTNNYGVARAINCIGGSYGAIVAEPYTYAIDFDLSGIGNLIGSQRDSGPRLKTISLMNTKFFPFNNTNEATVYLPKNALIRSIKVYKPASGTSASDYCIHIGNGDKSVVYVSSIPNDQKYTHRIDYNRGDTSIAQLTTRTDNDTGVFTFQGGNRSISEGDTVNVNWVVGGSAGNRLGMTVTSISTAVQGTITVSLDGGVGANLPVVNSDCYLSSVSGFINVGSNDNTRTVRMWSSNGDKSTAGGTDPKGGYAIIEYY